MFFVINEFIRLKKTNVTKFYVTKHDKQYETTKLQANREFELYKNVRFDNEVNEL